MQSDILSIRQIRAARALLDWTQRDLAKACKISVTAMNNLDRGLTQPRPSTLKKIADVLEAEGVEFTEGEGVRLNQEVFRLEVFEGKDAFDRYSRRLIDVLRTTKTKSINMLENEMLLIGMLRKQLYWFYAMTRKLGIHEKVMLVEGTTTYYGPPECVEYRCVPKNLTSAVGISIFGDYTAQFLPKKVILIQSASLADAYRNQLEQFWASAKPIKGGRCLFYEDEKRFGPLK